MAVSGLGAKRGGHSKYTLTIDGLKEARAAFKVLPDIAKEAYTHAVRVTASEVVRNAQAKLVPGHGFVTGALQRSLGYRVDTRGGAWIGIRRGFDTFAPGRNGSAQLSQGARAHRPTKIGHLVEFGHAGPHPASAHPFIRPALEGQEAPFLSRCRAAGREIERDMGKVGGRFV